MGLFMWSKKIQFLYFLLFLIMSFPVVVISQTFTTHTITTSADEAHSVYAVDLDGDGDVDVLSASGDDSKIAWYENDGSESFTAHTITTSANDAQSVYAVDLDGDGDVDVLSASENDSKIAWYENDGSESFTAYTITTSASDVESVYAVDLDGDGDMDVLSASKADSKIAWYENDGSESFTAHTITTSADRAQSVYAVDVDGDGDIDVLSASENDNKIAWYENDGSESFTAHTITTSADDAQSVYAVDLDGDSDIDVLSASANDNTIAWYENDGSESFTTANISTSAEGASSVYAVDVDGDGDMDVLSASYNDNKIAWYKNDGSESFTAATISTSAEGAESVYAVDLDGDGDMDVLSASASDDKISWYEQLHSTWHVSTTGSDVMGNGSPAAPFATIQHGIDATSDGDTVSVAAGTYVENINYNGKNIAVIGADSSNTIIDGDSITTVVIFNNQENSTALLKNFTLKNGYNSSVDTEAGGLYCIRAHPKLENLVISGNHGGGIALYYSDSEVKNTEVKYNTSAAAFFINDNSPTLTNVYIKNNNGEKGLVITHSDNTFMQGCEIIGNSGTGIDIEFSTVEMNHTTISNNTSSGNGGGIYSEISTLNIENSTLSGNTTTGHGAGIYANGSPFVLINSTINNNSAEGVGGGLYVTSTQGASIISSIISNNETLTEDQTGGGGGIDCDASTMSISETEVTSNSGGGIFACCGSNLTVDRVSVSGNISNTNIADGIYLSGPESINFSLLNSIVSGNGSKDISFNDIMDQIHTLTIEYSNIGDGQDSIDVNGHILNWGEGNIDADPLFCNPSDGDYTLAENSPCVGAGENGVNMGAFDVGCDVVVDNSVWHVSTDGSDQNGDGSEENPFATIQHGIDATSDGDTVSVAAGTYVENINYNGKNIVVQGEDRETTIIDGDSNGSVVVFNGGEDSTAVLTGFSIINGSSSESGGGILCDQSSPTITGCIISGNTAGGGGGIGCENNSNPLITDCTIVNNEATNNSDEGGGGGIKCREGSSPTLSNLTITSNTAVWGGGGIFCLNYSNPTITDVIIEDNGMEGDGYGGGISLGNSSPLLTNVVIIGNAAYSGGGCDIYISNPIFTNVTIIDNSADNGGGIWCEDNSSPTLTNCIISNNVADTNGGGIYCTESDPTLVNCILWNNSFPEIDGSVTATYSDIEGDWEGEGNIDADPLFIDPENGDYALQFDSPCIDAGDPDLDGDGITWEDDPDDQDPDGTRMDMGAFYTEYFHLIGTTVSSNPNVYSMIQLQDTINIVFADEFDPNSVESNINIESNGYGPLGFNLFVGSDNKTITIIPETSFPAFDTVYVQLSIGIKNPDGKYFDYDNDGAIGSLHFEYFTPLIADYTLDNQINFSDFIVFRDAWWEQDQINVDQFELHPFAGEIPNVIIEPDGVFAYDELITFTYMWNWSQVNGYSNNLPPSVKMMNSDTHLTFLPEFHYENPWDSNTSVSLDLNVVLELDVEFTALEYIFKYDPEKMDLEGFEYDSNMDNKWITLHYEDKETGKLVFDMAAFSKDQIIQPENELLVKLIFNLHTNDDFQIDYFSDIRHLSEDPMAKSLLSGSIVLKAEKPIPSKFVLHNNYPNPFNPKTTLRYELPDQTHVNLVIYDILGREVKVLVNGIQPSGYHQTIWDGRDHSGKSVSAGMYFYRIQAGSFSKVQKMVLLK